MSAPPRPAPTMVKRGDVSGIAQSSKTSEVLRLRKFGQNLCERPHLVEGIVQRHRGDADDIRRAKIADHARIFQGGQETLGIVWNAQRNLTAALPWIARRDDLVAAMSVEQVKQ